MSNRKRQYFKKRAENNAEFMLYLDKFTELATTMFEWENLPDTVDARFLELTLFKNGQAVFFKDEILGYLALENVGLSNLDLYGIPTNRQAVARNANTFTGLNKNNSVIIFNNQLFKPTYPVIKTYATRLWDIDKTIDVNCHSQKTPILIICDESQRVTMENAYMQVDGNSPVIFYNKALNPDSIKSLSTGAPFVADKLMQIRKSIWNEALTYLGIDNNTEQKNEHLLTAEANLGNSDTRINRYSRLIMRQKAAEEINKMFGLNISVKYRDDVKYSIDEIEKDFAEEVDDNE